MKVYESSIVDNLRWS